MNADTLDTIKKRYGSQHDEELDDEETDDVSAVI